MAKKKEVSKEIIELKDQVTSGNVTFGVESVLKGLRKDDLEKVFLASNCPQKFVEDVNYYSELVNVPVTNLEMDNEELGVFCKKHFFVSVVGVKKR